MTAAAFSTPPRSKENKPTPSPASANNSPGSSWRIGRSTRSTSWTRPFRGARNEGGTKGVLRSSRRAPRPRKDQPEAKAPEETQADREAKLEQVAARILGIVKGRPGISTKELQAAAPRMRAADFDAARARLERTNRIYNRTGKRTRTEWGSREESKTFAISAGPALWPTSRSWALWR